MTKRTTHDRNCGRLLLLTAGLIGTVPLLSAQTAKELMADACYNEIQQRKHDSFWTSEIQRREDGHVYLEREIETPSGPVHRLILVDGHEPSLVQRKGDDDQLRKLMSNPKAQQEMRKSHESDEKTIETLLSVIPNAFLFEDLGRQGNAERLGFRPNPAYVPKSYMEIAMHALSGTVLIDRQEKRLVELSAILKQQVNIGFGLVGSLKKGGTIDVRHARIQPGTWKPSRPIFTYPGASFSSRPSVRSKMKAKATSHRCLPR